MVKKNPTTTTFGINLNKTFSSVKPGESSFAVTTQYEVGGAKTEKKTENTGDVGLSSLIAGLKNDSMFSAGFSSGLTTFQSNISKKRTIAEMTKNAKEPDVDNYNTFGKAKQSNSIKVNLPKKYFNGK